MDEDLVEVASILAKVAQTTSPKQPLLRRAASTARYAVFQALAFGRSKVAEHIEQTRNARETIENIPLPMMRRLAAQLVVKRR